MALVRIKQAEALPGFKLRLTLDDGRTIERAVGPLLRGPVFERIRSDPAEFARVAVEAGTVVWPNGADLCPDVLIWNGPPPEREPAGAETTGARARR
ncbi:MAG: DUF2442 domain-containing protein [Alphaproteobacteria bacterium]|nr:DUF2442 domain-containing protein [Alphaproteobacteria bacterium]